MIAIGLLFARMLRDFFKPQLRLEAEILILRHQLNALQRRTPRRRLHLRWVDRVLFIWLYRRYPRILDALSIVRPETVVRWHRKGLPATGDGNVGRRPIKVAAVALANKIGTYGLGHDGARRAVQGAGGKVQRKVRHGDNFDAHCCARRLRTYQRCSKMPRALSARATRKIAGQCWAMSAAT
jgi:hypothetical protein